MRHLPFVITICVLLSGCAGQTQRDNQAQAGAGAQSSGGAIGGSATLTGELFDAHCGEFKRSLPMPGQPPTGPRGRGQDKGPDDDTGMAMNLSACNVSQNSTAFVIIGNGAIVRVDSAGNDMIRNRLQAENVLARRALDGRIRVTAQGSLEQNRLALSTISFQ